MLSTPRVLPESRVGTRQPLTGSGPQEPGAVLELEKRRGCNVPRVWVGRQSWEATKDNLPIVPSADGAHRHPPTRHHDNGGLGAVQGLAHACALVLTAPWTLSSMSPFHR